ncbi:MAG: nucleotide-binding protein [Thaumarchaeota archaeon]|nr:nucleotide-binding protein [Nitrososphaerota archaeon]
MLGQQGVVALSISSRNNFLLSDDIQKSVSEGKVRAYRCRNCDHKQSDIQVFCSRCNSGNLELIDVKGAGKVLTYTIQQVAPEQFANDVPYAWAIVELQDGIRITGWIPFVASKNDLKIGQTVRLVKSYRTGRVFEKV